MASGMGGQPQPQPTAPSQGQASTSMSMNVSPEKRSALKNYFDGYKDAIQRNTLTNQMSESMDQLLPNISSPQMPMQQPMMPQQPPMMMNMGGAVDVFEPQYMRNGGITVGGSFTNEDLKQAKEIVDSIDQLPDKVNRDNAMKNVEDMAVGYSPTALTAARGMMGDYDPDFGEEMGSLDYTPQGGLTGKGLVDTYSKDLALKTGGFEEEIPTIFFANPERFPNVSDYTPDLNTYDDVGDVMMPQAPLGRNEAMQGLIDNMNPLTKGINNIAAGIFGYGKDDQGNITPAGLAQMRAATQATLDPDSMQSSIARDRLKDQESAERKLAEEQRMRALIQSMMPAAPEAAPTEETAPIAETPPVADPVNYQDVVVPSDRVPNFSIPPLPVLPSTSPLLPQGISPELLRNLFKLQGVPASQMNQGGSVNKLDTAVDNFLSSVR
jgi:hypothetical protein